MEFSVSYSSPEMFPSQKTVRSLMFPHYRTCPPAVQNDWWRVRKGGREGEGEDACKSSNGGLLRTANLLPIIRIPSYPCKLLRNSSLPITFIGVTFTEVCLPSESSSSSFKLFQKEHQDQSGKKLAPYLGDLLYYA